MNEFKISTLGLNTGNQKFGGSFISMYDTMKYIAEHHTEHVLATGDNDVEYVIEKNGDVYLVLNTYSYGNLYMVYGNTMGISFIIDFNGSVLNKPTFTWLYHEGSEGYEKSKDYNFLIEW